MSDDKEQRKEDLLNDCVKGMLHYAKEHPKDHHFIVCKNCETILGIVTGWNSSWGTKCVDQNDTGCPHCGDNAAILIDKEGLLRKWFN